MQELPRLLFCRNFNFLWGHELIKLDLAVFPLYPHALLPPPLTNYQKYDYITPAQIQN